MADCCNREPCALNNDTNTTQCSIVSSMCILQEMVGTHLKNRNFILPESFTFIPETVNVEVKNGEISLPNEDAKPLVTIKRAAVVFNYGPFNSLNGGSANIRQVDSGFVFDIDSSTFYMTESLALEIGVFLVANTNIIKTDAGVIIGNVRVDPTKEDRQNSPLYYHARVGIDTIIPRVEWKTTKPSSILRSVTIT